MGQQGQIPKAIAVASSLTVPHFRHTNIGLNQSLLMVFKPHGFGWLGIASRAQVRRQLVCELFEHFQRALV